MILTPNKASGKPKKPDRYYPKPRESLNIQYKLKDAGETFVSIGKKIHITKQAVRDVIFGRRRSARIEAEIARILGKADWNEVVLEARSEIQKKPVKVILEEMRRTREGRLRAAKESLGEHIAQGMEREARRGA